MPQRPHVFIATPCFGGLVGQAYMQSVIGLMQHAGVAGFDLSLALLGHDALITRSRNTLLGQFMELPGATHILFVDADIAFEAAQVERMLRLGEEVVAGIYPLKLNHWDAAAMARLRGGEAAETAGLLYVGQLCASAALRRREGFATAIYAGTGFMLIARSAVARMIGAYPQTRYAAIHAYPLPAQPPPARHALFDCLIDPENGTYLSEDYAFCRRWRDIGGEIWLDTEGRLSHSGGSEFTGDPRSRFASAGISS
jgi:hypothetical protein